MSLRLRFWLLAMDALTALPVRWWGAAYNRIWLYVVGQASDATDWGPALASEEDESW